MANITASMVSRVCQNNRTSAQREALVESLLNDPHVLISWKIRSVRYRALIMDWERSLSSKLPPWHQNGSLRGLSFQSAKLRIDAQKGL